MLQLLGIVHDPGHQFPRLPLGEVSHAQFLQVRVQTRPQIRDQPRGEPRGEIGGHVPGDEKDEAGQQDNGDKTRQTLGVPGLDDVVHDLLGHDRRHHPGDHPHQRGGDEDCQPRPVVFQQTEEPAEHGEEVDAGRAIGAALGKGIAAARTQGGALRLG